jgi:fatty acid desaturase
MIDTYRLPASVAKSPTLKRMREDYHRSTRQPMRQHFRAIGNRLIRGVLYLFAALIGGLLIYAIGLHAVFGLAFILIVLCAFT